MFPGHFGYHLSYLYLHGACLSVWVFLFVCLFVFSPCIGFLVILSDRLFFKVYSVCEHISLYVSKVFSQQSGLLFHSHVRS